MKKQKLRRLERELELLQNLAVYYRRIIRHSPYKQDNRTASKALKEVREDLRTVKKEMRATQK